jgi:hypothetical protein
MRSSREIVNHSLDPISVRLSLDFQQNTDISAGVKGLSPQLIECFNLNKNWVLK